MKRAIAIVSLLAPILVSSAQTGSTIDAALMQFLLGNQMDATGLDANGDGSVNVADLVWVINDQGGGGGITPAQRMEAIAQVEDEFESLLDLPLEQQNQALLTFFDNHPMFHTAEITSQESVWAVFNDGEPLIVVNNRGLGNPSPPADPPVFSARAPHGATQHSRGGTVAPIAGISPQQEVFDPVWYHADMPQGRRAEVLSSVGLGFWSHFLALGLEDLLRQQGWEIGPVTSDTNRTVPDYKNLDNVGILYMSGHGAPGQFANFPELGDAVFGGFFAISTDDVVDAADYTAYRTDIDARNLAPMVGIYYEDAQENPVTETRWGLTENFFSQYASFGSPDLTVFGRGALVIMDACSTGDARLSTACIDKGAAFYWGWDAPVRDYPSADSTEHFLARLLGERSPFSDPVRPFDIDSILGEMSRAGWDVVEGSTTAIPQVPLVYERGPDAQLAILRPMIHTARVFAESEQLQLFGMFGENIPQNAEPTVTLGGSPLDVTTWESNRLVCALPPNAKGEIIVTIDGIESEPITLREWSGGFSFTGTTTQEGQFVSGSGMMRFRLCVDDYRLRPDDDPVFPWQAPSSIDVSDPDFFKFFLQHGDMLLPPWGSLETGSMMMHEYDGNYPVGCSQSPGVVSGSGTSPVVLLDPTNFVDPQMDMGLFGQPTFLTPPETTAVNFILGMGAVGIEGTLTYPSDCMIPPADFNSLPNTSIGIDDAPINTESFIIPGNSLSDDDGTFEWDQMTPDPPVPPPAP